MTFNCTLHITGTLPSVSAKAFITSYRETSQGVHYQKYQSSLEEYFQNAMDRSIRQTNVNAKSKSFSMKIEANQIQFISDTQNSMRYEYGSGSTPPKRFVQPAVIDTANYISEIIISDAIDIYRRNAGFGVNLRQSHNLGQNLNSKYFNKYSSLL